MRGRIKIQWKHHGDAGSTGKVPGAELAAVGFDDFMGDAEANAHATLFLAVEEFREVIECGWGETVAGVGEGDVHFGRLLVRSDG